MGVNGIIFLANRVLTYIENKINLLFSWEIQANYWWSSQFAFPWSLLFKVLSHLWLLHDDSQYWDLGHSFFSVFFYVLLGSAKSQKCETYLSSRAGTLWFLFFNWSTVDLRCYVLVSGVEQRGYTHTFLKNYLFLAALGLHCCTQVFSSCIEWGLLFFAACGLLTAVASFVAEHGL